MSEKKKHHTFRVQMPAREVMERLQNHYSRYAFTIRTIDVTGYDLTFGLTRLSLREDMATQETIVFVEYTDGNEVLADSLAYLLNGYIDLPSNKKLSRNSGKLVLDIEPSIVVQQLENLAHATEKLHFQRTPYYHALEYQHSEFQTCKSEILIYRGTIPQQTIILFKTYSLTVIEKLTNFWMSIALFWFVPTALLSGLVEHVNPNILCIISLAILVMNIGMYIRATRNISRVNKEFENWLRDTLQGIPQAIDADTDDAVETDAIYPQADEQQQSSR